MATVHIYERPPDADTPDGFSNLFVETAAATMQITRSMNVEDILSWWNVARKMFRSGRLPLKMPESYSVSRDMIDWTVNETTRVIVDRKRVML